MLLLRWLARLLLLRRGGCGGACFWLCCAFGSCRFPDDVEVAELVSCNITVVMWFIVLMLISSGNGLTWRGDALRGGARCASVQLSFACVLPYVPPTQDDMLRAMMGRVSTSNGAVRSRPAMVTVRQVVGDPPLFHLDGIPRPASLAHEAPRSREKGSGAARRADPHGDRHLSWRLVPTTAS